MEGYGLTYYYLDNYIFKSIDATYIICLEGSERIKSVHKQLSIYPPSHLIIIVNNPGYKKAKLTRPLCKQDVASDLAFTNYCIFQHANKSRFDNIMILEDDFYLNEYDDILAHGEKIDQFITNQEFDHYFPGVVPFISYPVDDYLYHWRILYGATTHAVITSRQGRAQFINDYIKDPCTTCPIDWYMINASHTCYMYYKPIYQQNFPLTENREEWENYNWLSSLIVPGIINNLGMEKDATH